MSKRFLQVMLVIISVLLFLNIFHQNIFSAFAEYGRPTLQNLAFRGNGISVVCSDNGRFVYAAANAGVFRSTEYGKAGSWEKVLE